MPIIPTYNEQIAPQGELEAHRQLARPDQFGSGIGEGMERLGSAMGSVVEAESQHLAKQDGTDAYVGMAKARDLWTQLLQDRANKATPGDSTFAPQLMGDMSKWLADNDPTVTPEGKRMYAAMSAKMTGEFGQSAIGIQAGLAAAEANNQFTQLAKSTGDTLFKDPSQRPAVQALIEAAVKDPNSIYANITAPHREELLAKLKNNADLATVTGLIRKVPGSILGMVAMELQLQFDVWKNLLDSHAAPGAKTDISPTTMAQAPEFTKAAATNGLNPAVVMAVADGASKANPTELASDLGALVSRYAGDYTKAVAAYHMGTGALDTVLRMNGSNWENAVPPAVQSFVNTTMTKAGAVPQASGAPGASAVPPVAPLETPRQPVTNSASEAFNGLTWEQQNQAINEDVRYQDMVMSMKTHALEEQKRLEAEAQEKTKNQFITRIYDPSKGSLSVHEVADDPTLTSTQKSLVVGVMFAYQRELKNNAETKSNPGLLNKLGAEMVAADNDPTSAPSLEPAQKALKNGQITMRDYRVLQSDYVQLKDANGNSFVHQMSAATSAARSALKNDPAFIANPEGAEAASARLAGDLRDAADAMRKNGGNPRSLLDPNSRDYFFKPGTIQSYTVGANQALAAKAAQVITDKSPVAGYTKGQQYKVNGRTREYTGGPLNLSTSWK